jgi:Glutathione peroxidase
MGNAIGSLVFKTTKEQLSHIPKSFWELQAKNIDGKLVDFHQLQGKKAYIVVNVASACGFTDVNYKGLSELYQKYR